MDVINIIDKLFAYDEKKARIFKITARASEIATIRDTLNRLMFSRRII